MKTHMKHTYENNIEDNTHIGKHVDNTHMEKNIGKTYETIIGKAHSKTHREHPY